MPERRALADVLADVDDTPIPAEHEPSHRLVVLLHELAGHVRGGPAAIGPRLHRALVRLAVQEALTAVGEPFSTAQVNRVANSVMLLAHQCRAEEDGDGRARG